LSDIKHSVGKVLGLIMWQFGVTAPVPFSGVIDDDLKVTIPGVMEKLARAATPERAPTGHVLKGVLFGESDTVMRWMHDKVGRPPTDLQVVALGIVGDGSTAGLIAGVYFGNHRAKQDISVTLYSESPVAGRPEAISTVFDYPCGFLDLPRVTAEIASSNTRMLDVAQRLGFELEGRKRKAAEDGGDMLIYGLTREDAKARGTWVPEPKPLMKAA